MPVTETPIYDQMQWELRNGRSEQPSRSASPSPRRGDDGGRRPVSVWALVDAHRRQS
jgi:hypothetical protein